MKEGDVVRYSEGVTALMRLEHRSGDRWYGEQYYGGTVSASINDVRPASSHDKTSYRKEEQRRHRGLADMIRKEISSLQEQLDKLRP